MGTPVLERRAPAYYWAPVRRFVAESPNEILGLLASANEFALEGDQRDAWQQEVEILQNALAGLDGTLFLEFDVPRLGSRIDAALISGSAIFPIEFKCGATDFRRADYNQAWDYGLDPQEYCSQGKSWRADLPSVGRDRGWSR